MVINDLNPLMAIDYGGWVFIFIIVAAWILLYFNRAAVWKADISIEGQLFNTNEFLLVQLTRYIPVLILISNSVWMLLSIYGIVFFTGRIINGFGVDSATDWFDTMGLFTLMGHLLYSLAFNKKKNE